MSPSPFVRLRVRSQSAEDTRIKSGHDGELNSLPQQPLQLAHACARRGQDRSAGNLRDDIRRTAHGELAKHQAIAIGHLRRCGRHHPVMGLDIARENHGACGILDVIGDRAGQIIGLGITIDILDQAFQGAPAVVRMPNRSPCSKASSIIAS